VTYLALARLGGARTVELYQDWNNQGVGEVNLDNLGHLGHIIRTFNNLVSKNNVSSVEGKVQMTSGTPQRRNKKRRRAERKTLKPALTMDIKSGSK